MALVSGTTGRVVNRVTNQVTGSGGGAGGDTPLLLDTYESAAAAYSRRKLRSAYSGQAIRARNAGSDESDIGFSGNAAGTSALESFVSGGDGFQPAWYDQSGNAVALSQATALNQPKIATSGVAQEATFDGAGDCLTTSTSVRTTGSYSISLWFYATQLTGANVTQGRGIISSTTNAGSVGDFFVSVTSGGAVQFNNWRNAGQDADGANRTADGVVSLNTWHHGMFVWNGTANKIYIDGSEKSISTTTNTLSNWGTVGLCFGQSFSSNEYRFIGRIAEAIIWHSAIDASGVADIFSRGRT